MTKEVVFVSDFFLEDGVLGGAEYYNDNLINHLSKKYSVKKINSSLVDISFVSNNFNKKFIIANFMALNEDVKLLISRNIDYCIIEHDHKYTKTNNPSLFRNFLVPEDLIINKSFFKSAKVVFCQSKLHSEVVQKNLLIDNICNLGGNIWTDEQLDVLQSNINNKKDIDHGIIKTDNKNKGMPKSIQHCVDNKMNYELLPLQQFDKFVEHLSRVKNLVFFPQWLESYSRLAIEARILNCKLITNSLLGVASESYFHLKGQELLNFIRKNNSNLYDTIEMFVLDKDVPCLESPTIPKVTILGTCYKSEKHIQGFLENIINQTIFDNCELIIINANSPENEEDIILEYAKKYKNIVYKKLDYRAKTCECFNMGIEMSTGDYLTFGLVDDRRSNDCLEILSKHLFFNPDIDLVYGDCLQTDKENETFYNNTSQGRIYEHSINQFSKSNMIKCLPGPMPLWRKKMNLEAGLFNVEHDFADDWEMWLKAMDNGSKFKKIARKVYPVGLYLSGGRSQGVNNIKQRKEEKQLFYKYKHIFGDEVVKNFKPYFDQF